jgi:hypothetical protein
MRRVIISAALAANLMSGGGAAHAQEWGTYFGPAGGSGIPNTGVPINPNTTYLTAVVQSPIGTCAGAPGPLCAGYIPLSVFAAASAGVAGLQTQITALQAQIDRAVELSAIAAAMKDAIPNPGDRFALRLNAAAFSGQGAGAIGFSYNVTESMRASVNYGQGRSQGIVSGGLNFSFR